MRPIQDPQSFIVHEECEKAAWQRGFRRQLGHSEGWAGFASTTVQGQIHLAATSARGPRFLALNHAGVIKELGLPEAAMPGPGLTRYAFLTLGELSGSSQTEARSRNSSQPRSLPTVWPGSRSLLR